MHKLTREIFIVLITATAVSAVIPANGKRPSATYPKQILGVWEGGFAPCKLPGNLDSDSRIEIKPKQIDHYEEYSTPLSVVQISEEPLAWKIKSELDMGDEYFHNRFEIFILGMHTLAIANKHMTFIYTRCE